MEEQFKLLGEALEILTTPMKRQLCVSLAPFGRDPGTVWS
jgi:hypothetical protein